MYEPKSIKQQSYAYSIQMYSAYTYNTMYSISYNITIVYISMHNLAHLEAVPAYVLVAVERVLNTQEVGPIWMDGRVCGRE